MNANVAQTYDEILRGRLGLGDGIMPILESDLRVLVDDALEIAIVRKTPLAARLAELEAFCRTLTQHTLWLHQTVHQAHHEGPIADCPKNTCRALAKLEFESWDRDRR